MNLPDLLIVGVSGVLLAYFAFTYLAYRKTRNLVMLAILLFTAYWTLVGALPILFAKRVVGGTSTSYIEDKFFLITIDGDYALTLGCYAAFMMIAVIGYLVFSKTPDRSGNAIDSFRQLSSRFSHIALVTLIAIATVPKMYVIFWLVNHGGEGTSLYQATRLVIGDNANYIRAYQYLNIITSYTVGCGAVLWVAFKESRDRYQPRPRALLWLAYLGLAGIMVGENLLLGNRAIPLTVMIAWAVGWWQWRYRTAPAAVQGSLRRRFGILAILGMVTIGLIGSSRGSGSISPETVLASAWENLRTGGGIVEQLLNSSERLAAHMALYGVIKQPILTLQPLVNSSYYAYAEMLNAPGDQNFTIHSVAAWWLRVGPIGTLVAGITFALILVILQRFAYSANGPLRGAFAVPAAVLPAMGAPVLLLRSGPESIRGMIVELILIPGAMCLVAVLVGERYARRKTPSASHPHPQPRAITPGEPNMYQSATSDITRSFAAIRRYWWVIVIAAVLGAGFGLFSTRGGTTTSYEAVVAMPSIGTADALGTVSSDARPPIDQFARQIQSADTESKLGQAVAGSAITATVPAASTPTSITIRVTANSDELAKSAVDAYTKELAANYQTYRQQVLTTAISSLDTSIKELRSSISQGSATANQLFFDELAKQTVRRTQLTKLAETPTAPPTITKLSSGNPSTGTTLLLATALACVAAGAIGLGALFDKRLRFRSEVEAITGPDSVLGEVGKESDWQLANVLGRLADQRGSLQVLPLGAISDQTSDQLAKLNLTVLKGSQSPGEATSVVVLATLGRDTRNSLESAFRALSLVDGPFAGVIVTR